MSLARTAVGIYSKKEPGTASFSTEEFTPAANSLLVVRVYEMRKEGTETDLGTPLIEGGGLTWEAVTGATTTLKPVWSTKAVWFIAKVGASPSKMKITVDDQNNLSIYEYVVSVLYYTGYDKTTPIGGTLTSGTTNIGDGAESRELSTAPRTGDETLLCIDLDASKGPPKPSLEAGWSSVHEKSASGESGIAVAVRASSTSKVVSITDSYAGGGTFSKAGMGALVVRAAEEAVDMEGALSGSGALTGTLTSAASMSANPAGSGALAAGELRAVAAMSAALGGGGALTGSLTSVAALSAALSAQGTLSGELRAVASLVAGLVGTGSLTGQLTALASMAADLEAEAVLDGELTSVASLAAELSGQGSLTGLLEVILGQIGALPTRASIGADGARARIGAQGLRAVMVSSRETRAVVLPNSGTAATVIPLPTSAATVVANSSTRASIHERRTKAEVL